MRTTSTRYVLFIFPVLIPGMICRTAVGENVRVVLCIDIISILLSQSFLSSWWCSSIVYRIISRTPAVCCDRLSGRYQAFFASSVIRRPRVFSTYLFLGKNIPGTCDPWVNKVRRQHFQPLTGGNVPKITLTDAKLLQ